MNRNVVHWLLIVAQFAILGAVLLLIRDEDDDRGPRSMPADPPPDDGDALPIDEPSFEPEIEAALRARETVHGH